MSAEHHHSPETFDSVVRAMRENLTVGVTVGEMADVVSLSPFHFLRVFHRTFGVPPGHFFTALRMDAAKRLLLTTPASVVDVCFAVGYSSPGTFSARFAYLVGETPSGYRALHEAFTQTGLWEVTLGMTRQAGAPVSAGMGRVQGPAGFQGVIFVGAFAMRVPQALPLAGVLLGEPGPYCLSPIADGTYHLLVAAVPKEEPQSLFLPGQGLLVGIGARTLVIANGVATEPVDILLRPPCETDPPIVVALPTLLRRQAARFAATAAPP